VVEGDTERGALPKKSMKSNHRKRPISTFWADCIFAQKVTKGKGKCAYNHTVVLLHPMSNEKKSPGDPSGRRVARQRAMLLAEAGTVARTVEVLLRRAGHDVAQCDELIRNLARQEAIELQRSYGRIESRNRFKTATHRSILLERQRSVLHIDEGGKSNPERLVPARPTYFSLAGIAMPQEKIDDYKAAANELKLQFFGRTDITFHEPQMRERSGWFEFDGDTVKQAAFDDAIAQLLEAAEFKVFGVGIRKEAFQREFVEANLDPYLPTDVYALAITLLLERYIDCLAAQPTARLASIVFESQGTREDAIHQLEYARALLEGSQWVSGKAFQLWLEPGLKFRPKCGSDPMEIADMFARDLYEWIRSECVGVPKRWELFNKKIYCRGNGLMGKFGVKVFPDSDIRDRIEAHRAECGAA
jgi:hypothetical protein